jgi:hypothetical protein
MYSLSGRDLHITYATSGEDGKPHLTYQDHTRTLHFSGDEIRVVGTDLGRVVSVSIRRAIDPGSTTFSLLVPRVNLVGEAAIPIRTEGITTMHKFSIAPTSNYGQLDFYTITRLTGFASLVRFPIRPEVITEVAPEIRPEVITEVAPEIRQEGRPSRRSTAQRKNPSAGTSRARPEVITEVAPEIRPSETEDK